MTKGKDTRVLIMATAGFEESELVEPREALSNAGMKVDLASPKKSPINGTIYDPATGESNVSDKFITPDLTLDEVDTADYDVLVLPGGLYNPDKLRWNKRAVEIANEFVDAGKVVAAICHGPWLLVETRKLKGRKMTGWISIRTDLENAGATVVDEPVVVDGNLITSRMPADIPQFSDAIIRAVEQGRSK